MPAKPICKAKVNPIPGPVNVYRLSCGATLFWVLTASEKTNWIPDDCLANYPISVCQTTKSPFTHSFIYQNARPHFLLHALVTVKLIINPLFPGVYDAFQNLIDLTRMLYKNAYAIKFGQDKVKGRRDSLTKSGDVPPIRLWQ